MQKMLKKNHNPNLMPVVLMAIMGITMSAFGQWEQSIQTVNSEAWDYIKPALQGGLFIWFALKVVGVFIQRDKEHNWWAMLMLLGAVIILEYVDDLYFAITGFNPVGSTTTTN
jgi:NhaP-type Na+/H+ or K+/H+ antiporter